MTVYLGIDIASKKFDVAELCDGNYRCRAFANTSAGFLAFYKWLNTENKQDIHACLEATGDYGTGLATFLYERNLKVSVVNPARIKGYGASELSRTKTDRADSKLIARFCKAANPERWKPMPAPVRKLQALVRRISALNGMLRMECNRRENADANIQASLDRIINQLKKEIESVRQELHAHVRSHDELKKQDELIQSDLPPRLDTTLS